MRKLVSFEGNSRKFWEGNVDGTVLQVRYGKLGAAGQSSSKSFDSPAKAEDELEKLVRQKLRKGYVEEAPDVQTPTTADFPFRFYGDDADDWDEGANDGHLYELRFVTAPDSTSRTKVAKAFEKALAKGVARPATQPWLWSGAHALFSLGERHSEPEQFFAEVRAALNAIHSAAPLAEAVFWGVRRGLTGSWGRSDWTCWSSAQQPEPKPGPALGFVIQGRLLDRALEAAVVDPNFEAARGGRAPAAAPAKLANPAKVALGVVPVAAAPRRYPTEEHAALFGQGVVFLGPGRMAAGAALAPGEKPVAAGMDGDGVVHWLPDLLPSPNHYLAQADFRADGAAVLLSVSSFGQGAAVSELVFASGLATVVWRTERPEQVRATSVYLEGGRLLTATGAEVLVLAEEGGAWRPIQTLAQPHSTQVTALFGGRVVAVTSYLTSKKKKDQVDGCQFYGVDGARIEVLGSLPSAFGAHFAVDDRLFASRVEAVEVTGLAEAYEATFAHRP